tara:strand:- start:23 stop:448 length:426 start_codon:yes stop_codon:yes gene_type:complete
MSTNIPNLEERGEREKAAAVLSTLIDKYRYTSITECHYPYYNNWENIPFTERLKLILFECEALNHILRVRGSEIIAVPHISDRRHQKYGVWSKKIAINIYFHGDPIPCITVVSGLGKIPVCYGTDTADSVHNWKIVLEHLT